MNTITPLMQAVMEALDTADDGLTDGEIRAAIDRLFSDDDLATALYDLFYVVDLTAQHIIVDDLTDEASTLHTLTDAGCAALWALQKADAVSRTVVRDHDAYNPARDGDLLAWKPGEPRVAGGVRPVYFNSRDEFIAYTSGAKA